MHNTLNILFSRAFHNLIELSNLNFISCLNPMISFLEFHFVHRSALYGFSQLLSIDLESEDLNSPWISFSVFWVFFQWFYATQRIWIFSGANARRHWEFIARTTRYSDEVTHVSVKLSTETEQTQRKRNKARTAIFLKTLAMVLVEFYFHIHSVVSELRVARDFSRENFNYGFMIIKWNRLDNRSCCLSQLISTR